MRIAIPLNVIVIICLFIFPHPINPLPCLIIHSIVISLMLLFTFLKKYRLNLLVTTNLMLYADTIFWVSGPNESPVHIIIKTLSIVIICVMFKNLNSLNFIAASVGIVSLHVAIAIALSEDVFELC